MEAVVVQPGRLSEGDGFVSALARRYTPVIDRKDEAVALRLIGHRRSLSPRLEWSSPMTASWSTND